MKSFRNSFQVWATLCLFLVFACVGMPGSSGPIPGLSAKTQAPLQAPGSGQGQQVPEEKSEEVASAKKASPLCNRRLLVRRTPAPAPFWLHLEPRQKITAADHWTDVPAVLTDPHLVAPRVLRGPPHA